MADTASGRVVSEKEFREWIPSCPVQIKKLRIEEKDPGGERTLTVFSVPCGDFAVRSFSADLEYRDDRRVLLGVERNTELGCGESAPVAIPYEKAVYASALIRSVTLGSGEVWNNSDAAAAAEPPKQKILWQTDPLYEAIRAECEGIVAPRFEPDEIDGAWRCACGQINLESAGACGSCGCSREWLKTHFDREYLEERKTELETKKTDAPVRVKKKRKNDNSDKIKALVAVLRSDKIKQFIEETYDGAVIFYEQ